MQQAGPNIVLGSGTSSFYSESVSVVIKFLGRGKLIGMIIINDIPEVCQEFVGLYEQSDGHIQIAFSIDIDSVQSNDAISMLFFGEIKSVLGESLQLSWTTTSAEGTQYFSAVLSDKVDRVVNAPRPAPLLLGMHSN